MKMVTALFALSLSATASFAQTGASDGSRYGHGQDSINCLQNISIYSEYVKQTTSRMLIPRGRVYSMKLLLLRQVLTQTVQRFFVGSLPMKKMQLSKSNILKN